MSINLVVIPYIYRCIDFANVLLQKDTSEFLRSSDSVITKLDETLRDEDKGLHKPLANTGLPVYLDTTFIHLVENFGVVGGGPIPKNIEAVHIKGCYIYLLLISSLLSINAIILYLL